MNVHSGHITKRMLRQIMGHQSCQNTLRVIHVIYNQGYSGVDYLTLIYCYCFFLGGKHCCFGDTFEVSYCTRKGIMGNDNYSNYTRMRSIICNYHLPYNPFTSSI